VRIDKAFAKQNPQIIAALVVHELLVYQKLHNKYINVSEEGVREASRTIRNLELSETELQTLLRKIGFGQEMTGTEWRHREALVKSYDIAADKLVKKVCANKISYDQQHIEEEKVLAIVKNLQHSSIQIFKMDLYEKLLKCRDKN
jgi:methanogenic corrinoid protein MtbC1